MSGCNAMSTAGIVNNNMLISFTESRLKSTELRLRYRATARAVANLANSEGCKLKLPNANHERAPEISFPATKTSAKSTIETYHRYLLDFISFLDRDRTEVENATAKEVMSYLNHLQKRGYENGTRGVRLGIIKQFFNYQMHLELREDNPVAHIKIRGTQKQKLYQLLMPEDLDKLFTSYEMPKENDPRSNRNWFESYRLGRIRNKSILSLLFNQGLTTAEIAKLELDDLKLREGIIHIKGSRKSNERDLELKSSQVLDLMEYTFTTRKELLKYQQNQEIKQLFVSMPTAGKVQSDKPTLQVFKGLTKDLRELNSNFLNFKQVRTSVITGWLKLHNLRQVQYMAGHRFVSSTEKYLINQMEDLQADVDEFHPI